MSNGRPILHTDMYIWTMLQMHCLWLHLT
jgi:hypothetical protein